MTLETEEFKTQAKENFILIIEQEIIRRSKIIGEKYGVSVDGIIDDFNTLLHYYNDINYIENFIINSIQFVNAGKIDNE
jgi:hypothetical protein